MLKALLKSDVVGVELLTNMVNGYSMVGYSMLLLITHCFIIILKYILDQIFLLTPQ